MSGGGHMGELMRAKDWSQTPLGPAESWPQSLRTAVSICLNSNFPILVWWGRNLVMLYNDAYRPILGSLKHPHALGQPGRECWPEIWPIIGPMLESVLASGVATWSEDQMLTVDRSGFREECYFTYSYSPIRDEDGSVGGVFGAVTETTWRVLADRRNQLLREFAEQTAGATTSELVATVSAKVLGGADADIPFALLYLLDSSGRFARRMGEAGFGDASIPLPQVIDLETPTVTTSPLADVARTGSLSRIDNPAGLWGVLPAGASDAPPTTALVLPLFGSSGAAPVGFLVAGASPKLTLSDDYRQFFRQVAERIGTALSAARAYEEERRRAEALAEIDRAKTVFFSNVSHEFRTPLALMLGMAEDLQDDPEAINPAAREQVEIIHRSSQRLLKLVNTLLDFSRIESGRIQACYEPTDLAALTTSLASMFRTATDRAGLPLLVDCPPLPEPVFVDREMWEKIFLNLLSNAFKFTLQGEITVRMESRDNQAVLTVSDTGVGIPEAEMRNLFTRFYRIPGSRGRTHEGSGIGLSLAMELVRLHGGVIEAESVEGRGSTFRVRIPLGSGHLPVSRIGAKGVLASTAISARTFVDEALTWIPNEPAFEENTDRASGIEHVTPPHFGSPHTGPLAGARIVFADDNADLRKYVGGLISHSGGEVFVATDGEVALEAIRSVWPDLVLTDVMMPHLDGFELLAAIRTDEDLKTVPVIMLSARAGEEARIEALIAGANDYIVKPFRSRELVARIESQINIARLRTDALRREQVLRSETEGILSSISLGFMAVDRGWRITYLNPAAERLAGIPPEELLGKTLWAAFPETVGKAVEGLLRRAMADRTHVQFEDYYEHADLWLETDVFPIEGGGLAFYSRDITDRKQAEDGLRESEERFRAMADGIPHIIWVTDQNSRMQFINRAYTEFFGVTLESVQNDGWEPLLHPDDRDAYTAAYVEALRDRKPFHAEVRIRRRDGQWRWVESFGQPRFSSSGEFLGIAGSSPDITDRVQTEQSLRREQSLLRNITQTTDFMLVYLDTDFNFVWVNDAYAESCRMQSADMIGKNHFELFPHAENEAIFRRVRDTGEPVTFRDKPFEFPDQPERGTTWWDWTLSPVEGDSGQVIGLVFSLRETTPVVRTREALRESEERLYLALRGTQEGVWDWNLEDNTLWLSYRWFHMLGYDVGELPSEPDTFFGLVHPKDLPRVRAHIDCVLHGNCEFNLEFRLRHKDGRYVDILSRALAVRREPDHRITRLVGTHLDLTEDKQIEKQIERISRFPAENPDPVLRVALDGTLLFANDASAPLLEEWRVGIGRGLPEPWRTTVIETLHASGPQARDIHCGDRTFSLRIVPIPGADYVNLYGRDITEQRRVTDALRQSEERLRSTLDHMLEGCAILSPDWTFLYVNHANARHAHLSREDMIGRNMVDLIPGVKQSPFFEAYRACMEDRTPRRVESEFVFPDGNRAWFEVLVQPVPEGIFVLSQEISDRKLYEQALRQSEQRFRIALQNSPITVATLDRDLRYTWIYNTRHGFSPDAVIGKRPDQLLPPEDIAELMGFFRHILETGRPERREISGYNGDLLLEYDVTAEPIRDADGVITGLNAVFIDIVDHKRTQRILEENRRTISRQLAEIEAIYAQAPIGLCVIDRDLRFVHINERMAQLNGLPIRAHLGAQVSDVLPGMADLAGRILQAILASGQPMLNVEIHSETPAQPGVPRDFIEHWLPLTDANGEIFAVNVVVEEVTERKRIEAELRHRTRELEIANEDLQRFGSYLAHDLRTPLRAIRGFADILKEDYAPQFDETGAELLTRIASATDHAGEIIADIQRLAKLDTGEFVSEWIDLGEIAQELIDQARLREPERVVQFLRHPDLFARADRRLITIALSNLLDNAWKYTGKISDACIEFGLRPRQDGPVFFIKDNGAGFDPALADKLFQPFQRLHAPSEFPGTGLGLTIVRKVITRHNGRVWAESDGPGATVFFTLNA